MECEAVQDRIEELIHGFVPPAESRELRKHLIACPVCGQRYQWAESLALEVAGKATRHGVPAGLRRVLEREVSRAAPGRWFRSILWVPGLALTVVGLVLVVTRSVNRQPMRVEQIVQTVVGDFQKQWFGSRSGDAQRSEEDLGRWLAKTFDMEEELPFRGNEEFRLEEARVMEISGRKAALLVYRQREATIGFFLVPAEGIEFPVQSNGSKRILVTRQGYISLTWPWSSYVCSLVSKRKNREQVVALWGAMKRASTRR